MPTAMQLGSLRAEMRQEALAFGPKASAVLVFECPALQYLRDKRPHLFEGTQADATVLFMWQDDLIGVVRFVDERLYTSDSALRWLERMQWRPLSMLEV